MYAEAGVVRSSSRGSSSESSGCKQRQWGCNSSCAEDAPIKVVAMGWKIQRDDTDGELDGISVVGSMIGIHGLPDRFCRKPSTW